MSTTDNNTLLAQLVAFPSVSDDVPTKKALMEFIGTYLQERGMYLTWFEFNGEPAMVASTRPGHKTPAVTLAGHVDVVAAPKELFNMRAENGRLYGRGVYDMKFALASYMRVVDILRDQLDEYDFSVMLVADEEDAGKTGVSSSELLIDEGYVPQVVVIPDGGRDWQLESFAKGFMHYKLEAHGRTAHGSRPWEGENALFKLIGALSELKDTFKDHGPDTDTLNIGIIKSGEAVNKIPDYATAEIEMRLNSLDSLAERSQMIDGLCNKHDIKDTLRVAWEPVVNDLNNPYLQRFTRHVEDVVGVKNTGFKSFGGSDARFFANAGVPYANFYPFGGGHHSAEEWIEEDSVDKFVEVLLRYLREIAHTTSADEAAAELRSIDAGENVQAG